MEKEIVKRLKERGFKEDGLNDAESFISDRIIGDEIEDGVEFEENVKEKLKEIKK